MTRESIDLQSIEVPEIIDRHEFGGGTDCYQPFQVSGDCEVPDFLPIGDTTLVRQTSSTHGEDGYITTDKQVIDKQRRRMKDKLEKNVTKFTFYDFYPEEGAETLIVTFGVTARAALQAIKGIGDSKASLLVLKTLWPVPEELIAEKGSG